MTNALQTQRVGVVRDILMAAIKKAFKKGATKVAKKPQKAGLRKWAKNLVR